MGARIDKCERPILKKNFKTYVKLRLKKCCPKKDKSYGLLADKGMLKVTHPLCGQAAQEEKRWEDACPNGSRNRQALQNCLCEMSDLYELEELFIMGYTDIAQGSTHSLK